MAFSRPGCCRCPNMKIGCAGGRRGICPRRQIILKQTPGRPIHGPGGFCCWSGLMCPIRRRADYRVTIRPPTKATMPPWPCGKSFWAGDDALQFADSAASMGDPVHFAGSDGGGGGRVPRSGSFQRLPALRALPTGLPRRRHRRRRVSLAQVYPRLYGGGYASGGHGANDRAYGM